jgi:hypothetical protein
LRSLTDLNTIRAIPFYGKVDEWLIWSERFLAKSRRSGFKDLMLGKLSIPTVDEKFDEGTESGKKKSIAIHMNEIAYTKLILSIDVKTNSEKLLLILLKAVRAKTTLMVMLLLHGKGSRTSMSLSLILP